MDGKGRFQGSLARSLKVGHHRIGLAKVMPTSNADAGLYFLKLQLGNEAITYPFVNSGNRSSEIVFAPPQREAASKQAAVLDTLRISKTGYRDLVKEISSYTIGNLGDLTLTPNVLADGWVNIFNGKDLTTYRIRVTYRFPEPQTKNPVNWGKNNSGLMIFAIDPTTVTGDPLFPPLIEIQLLGNGSTGGSTNPNYCQPNGMEMTVHTADCGDNHTGKAPNPPGQWTTVEAEVHVNDVTRVFQFPDSTKPVFTMSGPKYNGQPVKGGYLTLQSESHPIEFKDILLKELP